MFIKRFIVSLVLLPIGIATILAGGWAFGIVIAVFMGLAAWEFVQIYQQSGYKPSMVLAIGGTLLLLAGRLLNGFESSPLLVSILVLASMAYHLWTYERGRDQAAADFTITLAGFMYLGWIGSYLISLRSLPEGEWWTLTVLPAVWLADMGAYFIGKAFGRHKLVPRLSPKKTWEGYWGGIVFSLVITPLLVLLLRVWAGPDSAITPLRAGVIGLVMGIFPTLGDLGESMIKRMSGVKDSGTLLPGHGGFFDRVDSWLWAGVIGYYLIQFLWY
jgi:phosphatidate cytidylyltransferase